MYIYISIYMYIQIHIHIYVYICIKSVAQERGFKCSIFGGRRVCLTTIEC